MQRWLKFSKFLPEYRWQPVIYTPENPDVPVADESLCEDIDVRTEVVTTRITEPYDLYRKIFRVSKEDGAKNRIHSDAKSGFRSSVANFIRANFFVPDPRALWIRSSVKFLKEYLINHPVDMIISTGPPHSMHLIAYKLTKKIPCPWIADFRDPWTGMFYFKHLNMLPPIRARHRVLEREVVNSADMVLVVSNRMKENFSKIQGADPSKIKVITNGYDPDDFLRVEKQENTKFTIVHTGLMVRDGNPENVWKALKAMLDANPSMGDDLEIRLIGETDSMVFESIEENGLSEYLKHIPYLPHQEAVEEQVAASLLLLPLRDEPEAGVILTGKFFEYLASERPILAIGPKNGDLGNAIRECNAGDIYEFSEYDAVLECLKLHYENYINGGKNLKPQNKEAVSKYSRKELTRSLAEIMQVLE